MKNFSLIIAVDNENGIGKDNTLSWSIPEDMKYFKKITTTIKNKKNKNALIMGRKTWESIPKKFRPLEGRYNCILSRSYKKNAKKNSEGGFEFNSIDAAMEHLGEKKDIENIFIIGGAELYNSILKDPRLKSAYITRIYNKYHCDVFFDGLPNNFDLISRSPMKEHEGIEFEFSVYNKKTGLLKKIFSIFKK